MTHRTTLPFILPPNRKGGGERPIQPPLQREPPLPPPSHEAEVESGTERPEGAAQPAPPVRDTLAARAIAMATICTQAVRRKQRWPLIRLQSKIGSRPSPHEEARGWAWAKLRNHWISLWRRTKESNFNSLLCSICQFDDQGLGIALTHLLLKKSYGQGHECIVFTN